MANPDQAAPGPEFREVRYEISSEFLRILKHCGATLLVSTYQAGKVVVVGQNQDRLALSLHNFDRAMGIAAGADKIAVGARGQIWFLKNASELAGKIEPAGCYDRCYLTRSAFVTGNIQGHEMAWSGKELWVVNTLFSCLCTLHEDFSFVPRWRPPFISALAAEDRCHVNGLAMVDDQPTHVTALSETDEPAGWRPTKGHSGCIIDVKSGEIVASGLAMPHSPRWHDGRLWVLDSGTGRLCMVEPSAGRVVGVTDVPGYTRGLAFCGQFAFVGMSRIRETSVFGGVPIAEKRDELRCGVAVVDLVSGRAVAFIQFTSGVDEIFDVQVIPSANATAILGPYPDLDGVKPIWLVPRADQVETLVEKGRSPEIDVPP